ncbi:hypothetical protein [Streptomyces fructofermentans]|uniref:Uncharacterized protein n=1 Tax=Streptomyces fructofermentans TaxID=152141 RepID=A0A918U649_9ACTN|nr:hypothetical protein [Streptomyces fructofermentans]GGX99125.1 hypothetical protein GCM10010515_76620 [Streptomyces fructofermentans]
MSKPNRASLVDILTELVAQVRRLADYRQNDFVLSADVLEDDEATCDTSALTPQGTVGPCVLRPHKGPVHRGPQGEEWSATFLGGTDPAPYTRAANQLRRAAGLPPHPTDDAPTTPATTWTPSPLAITEAVEWARGAGKASATIEALTANAGCAEHPNAGSVGPYCLACVIVPPPTDRRPPMNPVHILSAEAQQPDDEEQRQEMAEERYVLQQQRDEADKARTIARRDRDQHAAVLREVLAEFRHETHPGQRCLQSGHVPVADVERWRSVVAPTVERPWWEQVAQYEQAAVEATRHVLELKAAVERVRKYVAVLERGGWSQAAIGRRVLAALDGTEQPAAADIDEALPAKLDEATGTLRRVRTVVKDWERRALPHSEAYRLLVDVRNALAGPRPDDEQPTTEA